MPAADPPADLFPHGDDESSARGPGVGGPLPVFTGPLAFGAAFGDGEEPNPFTLSSAFLTALGRTVLVALLWGVCAAVVWLWWPQWRADFSRSEPWLAALSWWGEVATVAWATGAILMGRLGPFGPAGVVPAGDTVRRWAVAGVLFSLALDFGVSLGGYVADLRADARTINTFGWPSEAERVVGPRGDGADVRVKIRFVLLPENEKVVMHLGSTTVRLPPPAEWANGPAGEPVGPDRLPPSLAAWAWKVAVADRDPGWIPPWVPVRYDPHHPGRFWVGGQTWDRGAPSRLLLAILPLLQIGILLSGLRWRPWPAAPDPHSADPLGRLLARHLPAFPLASELVFLAGWGVLEAGWLL